MDRLIQSASARASSLAGAVPWNRVAAVVSCVALGVFFLLGTGFAQPDVLHNAAHDARHAMSFPCH